MQLDYNTLVLKGSIVSTTNQINTTQC